MNYHNITYPDMNNGPGLRVCLWLSACSHHCPECQNHQTWNPDSGIEFNDIAKREVFDELSKDYISGLTLSGGDPLHENNLSEVLKLVNEIRLSFGDSKTIWTYTGYTWEQIFPQVITDEFNVDRAMRQNIVELCDVLVDGRYVHELRDITLPYRGSSNQRLIDVQETLVDGEVRLWKK